MFILFTILSPILRNFVSDVSFNEIFNLGDYSSYVEVSSDNVVSDMEVLRVYKEKMASEIVNTLEQKGFRANIIDMEVSNKEKNYGAVTKLSVEVKDSDSKIKKVDIRVSNSAEITASNIDEKVKQKIKDILNETFGIEKESIFIQ